MIRFVRRKKVTPLTRALVPLTAFLVALVLATIFLLLAGFQPIEIFSKMVVRAFATKHGLSDTIVASVPILLAGLAASISFRHKIYNIGGEGQLIIGAIAATGIALVIGDRISGVVAIPLALVAAAVAAAVWMLIAAVPKVWLGTNEIVTTLLTNYVAILFISYLIFDSDSLWKDKTSSAFPQGARIGDAWTLPKIAGLHTGIIIAILVVIGAHFLFNHSRFGFSSRVLAASPKAATYVGVKSKFNVFLIMIISASVAGLAGGIEVLGRSYRLDPSGLAIGLGYAGIVVAALAGYKFISLIPYAFLIGGITIGGSSLQYGLTQEVPSAISELLQGIILLALLSSLIFLNYRIRWRAPKNEADLGQQAVTTS